MLSVTNYVGKVVSNICISNLDEAECIYIDSELESCYNQNGSVTNNSQTDNYYNTFNIESDDPEEVPRQVDIILQQNRLRNNLAKGGA